MNRDAIAADDPRQRLLMQAFDARCLFDARIDTDPQPYQTALVELVPEHAYLVLDGFAPPAAIERFTSPVALRLHTRLRGLSLRFTTTIVQRGGPRERPYFKALYPETIAYAQRRRAHRVALSIRNNLPVRVTDQNGIAVSGAIRDLSRDGFSARLTRGNVERLADSVPGPGHCSIALPAGAPLAGTITLCRLVPARGRVAARLSARFQLLDPAAERVLARFLATLDASASRPP